MTGLAEFLLARIKEREDTAKATGDGRYWIPPDLSQSIIHEGGGTVFDVELPNRARHIAANDPAYVLADCAAKRAIIEMHGSQLTADDAPYWSPELRALALPYADHPDFNPDWRP